MRVAAGAVRWNDVAPLTEEGEPTMDPSWLDRYIEAWLRIHRPEVQGAKTPCAPCLGS